MVGTDFRFQIRMNISAAAHPPHWQCPESYHLRKIEPGDEIRLPELLRSIGVGWTKLNEARVPQYMSEPDRRHGSHVIEHKDQLVALCISTRRDDVQPVWGQLDYVCVRPEHRGLGLSVGVCTAVLDYQRSRGYPCSTLTTLEVTPQNLQLAPMNMYLKLQFQPVKTEQNQTACEMIYQALDRSLPVCWWMNPSPFDPIDDPGLAQQ